MLPVVGRAKGNPLQSITARCVALSAYSCVHTQLCAQCGQRGGQADARWCEKVAQGQQDDAQWALYERHAHRNDPGQVSGAQVGWSIVWYYRLCNDDAIDYWLVVVFLVAGQGRQPPGQRWQTCVKMESSYHVNDDVRTWLS